MAIGNRHLIDLLRGLTASVPETRDAACGTVTDWVSAFSPTEAAVVASVVAAAATVEADPTCRESQLHALTELGESASITAEALSPLTELDVRSLQGSEIEYLDYLRTTFGVGADT
ncbi:hypothetical protein [Streptomyces sp. URMC 129]|uniref:hypothetical protein n=1 Tax=Streptomyces sp. URMC 129 TaxID=3423407 RepID=UPI003F1B94F0